MKKTGFYFLLGVFFVMTSATNAQRIVKKSGSFAEIKGEKFFNIKYVYDDMRVGKFENEQDYVDQKVAGYNEKKPGSGDKWKEKWIGDRKSRFQPSFEDLLNKYLNKSGVFIDAGNKDSKYIMIVNTTFTEPGYNIYISKKNAMIDVEIIFVETANPDKELLKIIVSKSPGRSMGYGDYDTGTRVQEAYAKCGKELGKWLSKQVFLTKK